MANTQGVSTLAETGWYNGIYQTLNEILQIASQGIFDGASALIHNNMSYTIIAVTIMVWLILRLKNGYPSKDEMFSAGKWLMIVLLIYAIFYSYANYKGFISLFMLPANWVRSIVATAMGFEGRAFIDIINEASDTINKMCKIINQQILKENDNANGALDSLAYAIDIVSFSFFWLYIALLYIALFGGLLIMTGSQFISALILTTAPIMIPFILYRSLRAYFFSWLKLFISYSLYAPIALIIISIVLKPINEFKENLGNAENYYKNLDENTFVLSISYMLIVIFGIYLMTKIPNWVSQIIGVQGLDGAGSGAGQAALSFAGKATAATGIGAVAGGVTSAIAGRGVLKGAIGGGLKGMTSSIPGSESAKKIWDTAKGFKEAKSSTTNGATAKAG